ncbi:MAG: hypothetical protein V3V63_02130 [Candidatus Hydrothermarchaeaceae archaeon]
MRLSLNTFCFILVGAIIIFTIVEKALFVSEFGHPSGDDIKMHLTIVQGWLDLENPLLNEKYFYSGYPRPPAMHLTIALISLIPFVSLLTAANFLEIFLFPLILLVTFSVVQKISGTFTAALSILILATSPAFWDRGVQVIPQAFDILLFPAAAYLFLKGRNAYIPICIYLIYNHWLYAALPVSALFIFSMIYRKERLRDFGIVAIACIPIAVVMALNTGAMLAESSGINEAQELAVLTEPLFAVKYLGYPLFFLMFISAIHLRYVKLRDFERLILLWILTLVPMVVFFPDRFIEYVAQPLAILGGIVLADLFRGEKVRATMLFALFAFALLSQYYLYSALFSPQGIWMPLDTLSPFVRPAP